MLTETCSMVKPVCVTDVDWFMTRPCMLLIFSEIWFMEAAVWVMLTESSSPVCLRESVRVFMVPTRFLILSMVRLKYDASSPISSCLVILMRLVKSPSPWDISLRSALIAASLEKISLSMSASTPNPAAVKITPIITNLVTCDASVFCRNSAAKSQPMIPTTLSFESRIGSYTEISQPRPS